MFKSKKITLHAPMKGVLVPIERVPDPVFAEKMVGDGVSIDPLEEVLRAPCNGVIQNLHNSLHAVTIKTPENLEILLHIGLDTVMLKGEGFTPLIKTGDRVNIGDELIKFDMDLVGSKAPSLLTQMVVSTMDIVKKLKPVKITEVSSGEVVCTINLSKAASSKEIETKDHVRVESEPIVLPNPVGLHARPAAVLAKLSKEFSSEISIVLNNAEANAKSVTSILKLNSKHGDKITLIAKGEDAREAIDVIVPEIISGLGDEGCIPVREITASEETIEPRDESTDILKGMSASIGLGTGRVFILEDDNFTVTERGKSFKIENEKIQSGITRAKKQLMELYSSLEASDSAKAEIFSAHIEILEDPDLITSVNSLLKDGYSAEFSWKTSYQNQAKELSLIENSLLAERANDMTDVGKRVLRIILGLESDSKPIPEGSILIAEDLTPSFTATLNPDSVQGFCTVKGGTTSHVAIIARSLGIPAVVGVDKRILSLKNGDNIVINGTTGEVKLNPDNNYIQRIVKLKEKRDKRVERERSECKLEPSTTDGHRIEVVANVGSPTQAKDILSYGGEGVGLLRSEFLFQDRQTSPTEEEQFIAYRSVLEAVGSESTVVIRTLDVGGDKPLSYLPLPKEENPFLGERGIRVCLRKPEILRTQLRALLRASAYGNLHIMFPMVGTYEDWREAKVILDEEKNKMGITNVPTGIMIEVPSSALIADKLAKEVDFFSVGTNDLTQYTMAIDRGHPKLASKADGLHPSVLRLIKMTVDAAHNSGKWVGVCGGLAGDPQAVPILLGLGIDELSVSIPSIPSVKAQIRGLSISECKELAEDALNATDANSVRILSPNPYIDEIITNL